MVPQTIFFSRKRTIQQAMAEKSLLILRQKVFTPAIEKGKNLRIGKTALLRVSGTSILTF
jgi:hypothetical protein